MEVKRFPARPNQIYDRQTVHSEGCGKLNAKGGEMPHNQASGSPSTGSPSIRQFLRLPLLTQLLALLPTIPGIELRPPRSVSSRIWHRRRAGETDREHPSLPRKLRGLTAPAQRTSSPRRLRASGSGSGRGRGFLAVRSLAGLLTYGVMLFVRLKKKYIYPDLLMLGTHCSGLLGIVW